MKIIDGISLSCELRQNERIARWPKMNEFLLKKNSIVDAMGEVGEKREKSSSVLLLIELICGFITIVQTTKKK